MRKQIFDPYREFCLEILKKNINDIDIASIQISKYINQKINNHLKLKKIQSSPILQKIIKKNKDILPEPVIKYSNSNHIKINKTIIKVYDMNTAIWIAIMLSQWRYHRNKNELDQDDFFAVAKNKIRKYSWIGLQEQTKIIEKLKEDKIIEIKKTVNPDHTYYKFNLENLTKKIEENKADKNLSIESKKGDKNE